MRAQLALAVLLGLLRSARAGVAAADVEYSVVLRRAGAQPLGFSLGGQGAARSVASIVPGGALDAWNKANPANQVQVGDEIVQVNGLKASNPGFIAALKMSGELRIELWRRIYSVSLDKSGGMQLGVHMAMGPRSTLVITGILRSGLVAQWNMERPGAQVQLGDEILEINGLKGDAPALYRECTQNKLLRMKLWRGQLVQSKPPGQYYFSEDATRMLEDTYWPRFAELFLMEGTPMYPMPPSSKVADLLPSLRGVRGIAVHTDPGITVSEGQGYAMLAAGMRKDVQTLMGLTVAWQAAGQGFADAPACGGCGATCAGKPVGGCLCKTVPGAYMPGWSFPMDQDWKMGSATDADQDAITGLIYLAELTDSDEFRRYAVRSIVAFVLEDIGYGNATANSRRVPVVGDIPPQHQTMYLWRSGTCGGGYDKSSHDINHDLCISPGYFAPGQWRLFQRYLRAHAGHIPAPYTADVLGSALESAIVWGYNTLQRIACPNGMVSNWWSLPATGWPYHGKLQCTNSGTKAGAYYSDAARIPWRVVLDYLWFPEERTPFYDEQGMLRGYFGAKEYANRWSGAWMQLIEANSATPLSKDGLLGLLSQLQGCHTVPMGFTAMTKNGWGSLPVVTTFQVPLEGLAACRGQQWLDYVARIGLEQCVNNQYFDLGQEVIIGSMLGGNAWFPLSTTAFLITLDKADGMELGLDLDQRGPVLFVKQITGGLVGLWNERNPFWSVMVGDEIATVNDITLANQQVQEIRTQRHLIIKFWRTERTRTSSCPRVQAAPSIPTPAPAPAAVQAARGAGGTGAAGGKCAAANTQCGGKDWTGVTCCEQGCQCKVKSQYYSQCAPPSGAASCAGAARVQRPAPHHSFNASGAVPSSAGATRAAGTGGGGKCAAVNKQCGGKDWRGATCCEPGCHCKAGGPYYSQCVPATGKTFCSEEHVLYDAGVARQLPFGSLPRRPLGAYSDLLVAIAIVGAAPLLASLAFSWCRRAPFRNGRAACTNDRGYTRVH